MGFCSKVLRQFFVTRVICADLCPLIIKPAIDMCSIDETEQLNGKIDVKKGLKKKNSKIFTQEGMCMKCEEKAVVLVRNNDPFCKSCFLEYAVHKFRATIGKARVIHQGERVLLAVSGGPCSTAMLDLVIKGLGEFAVKKHRFVPGVVFIDDKDIYGKDDKDIGKAKEHLEALAMNAGFPFYFVSLADIFSFHKGDFSLKEGTNNGDVSNITYLKELFSATRTISAKEDLMLHLYRNMLQKVAQDNDYDYIMVGDCATNISVRILADVAQGRGSQLPFNVGFKDSRSDIAILRPMREFTKKEIQYYNHFSNVTFFTHTSFTTKASGHASVNRLTEELILGLQAGFPSTVNTVLKTGDKISLNLDCRDGDCCLLCRAPLMISSKFSSSVLDEKAGCLNGMCVTNGGCSEDTEDGSGTLRDSMSCTDGVQADNDSKRSCDGACGDNTKGRISRTPLIPAVNVTSCDVVVNSDIDVNEEIDLSTSFCHGCQLTLRDIKDHSFILPQFVTKKSDSQTSQQAMKGMIKEFLLSD